MGLPLSSYIHTRAPFRNARAEPQKIDYSFLHDLGARPAELPCEIGYVCVVRALLTHTAEIRAEVGSGSGSARTKGSHSPFEGHPLTLTLTH